MRSSQARSVLSASLIVIALPTLGVSTSGSTLNDTVTESSEKVIR
jgi:hypothetical protein